MTDSELDKLTDAYVQVIVGHAHKYLERDEMLLRKLIRQILDQYASKREAEDRARHA